MGPGQVSISGLASGRLLMNSRRGQLDDISPVQSPVIL